MTRTGFLITEQLYK